MTSLGIALLLVPAFGGVLYLIREQVKRRGLEAQICRLVVLFAVLLSSLLGAMALRDAYHYRGLFSSSIPMTAISLTLLAFNRANPGQARLLQVLLPVMIVGLTLLGYLTALAWAQL